jgi:hypothetical protein
MPLAAGHITLHALAPSGSLLPGKASILEQNYPENFFRRIDAEIVQKHL